LNQFSKLYKKMGATADEIQSGRFHIRGDDRVEGYRRESYLDQDLFELLSIKGLTQAEMEKQVDEYVWIPTSVDLRDVFFGDRRIRDSEKYDAEQFEKWQGNYQGLINKENRKLLDDEIVDALTLIFVMKHKFRKEWDWDNQCWKKIAKGK